MRFRTNNLFYIRDENQTNNIVLVFLAILGLSYYLSLPSSFLIIDEVSYFEQAYAIAEGQIKPKCYDGFSQFNYPAGTAILASILIKVFGTKQVWLLGMVCLGLGYYFTSKTLLVNNLKVEASLLILIFPPAAILGHTIMSDIPSLAIASLFFYLVFTDKRTSFYLYSIGFLAGISILFRESNIILFIPALISVLAKFFNKRIYLLAGLCTGILLRLFSAYILFGNPFFIKPHGSHFGFDSLRQNLLLYLPTLLIFIPAGLYWVSQYSAKFSKELKWTVLLFTLFYLSYNYNGENSGIYKSWILGPRFFIPLLPLFCIAAGQKITTYSKEMQIRLKWSFRVLAVSILTCTTTLTGLHANTQRSINNIIEDSKNELLILVKTSQNSKYINNLHPGLTTIYVDDLTTSIVKSNKCYVFLAIGEYENIESNQGVKRIKVIVEKEPDLTIYEKHKFMLIDKTQVFFWDIH